MNLKVLFIILTSSFCLISSDQNQPYCSRKLSKLTDCKGNEIKVSNVGMLVSKTKGKKGEPGYKGKAGLKGQKGLKGEMGRCNVEDINYLMREMNTIKNILNRELISLGIYTKICNSLFFSFMHTNCLINIELVLMTLIFFNNFNTINFCRLKQEKAELRTI